MLRLRTFGGLSIDREASEGLGGAAAQRRPLALLAMLAGAGERAVPRAKLIQQLWADSDEEKARRVLAQTVYTLRRDLGRDDLVLGTTDLRLNPDAITTDLAEFHAAIGRQEYERAVAIYRGPFLDGFYLSDAPEFERWAEEERTHLAERYRRSLRMLASEAKDRGDRRAEAGWFRRLASVDPLDAGVALDLMRSLAASGDRSAALQHARVYETLLRQELDVPPDSSITAFATQLREAPAEVLAPPKRLTPAPRSSGRASDRVSASVPAAAKPPRRHIGWGLIAALTVVGVGVILAVAWRQSRQPVLVANRVLVAPFENNTGDTALNPVGRMAADWVTQRLAETGLVDVVDARTAMLTGGASTPRTVRALAEQTGAGTVVWGSYYRDGDSLRFQAQISDARAGRVLRGVDPVSGPVRAPLIAVDRLREHVTGALALLYNPRLSDWIQRATSPPTYAAYQEFVTGLDLHGRGEKREAIAHYLRATALDTTYVQPLLWAVDAYLTMHEYAGADSLIGRLGASRARLAPFDRWFLDNSIAQIHGDWPAAVRTAHQMVEAAPGGEGLLDVGYFELALDHPHAALAAFRQVDVDRGWMKGWDGYWQFPAAAYHLLGDHCAELAVVREGRARFPTAWRVLSAEVRALAALGRVDELTARVEESAPLAPSDTMNAGRLMLLAYEELRAHGHGAVAGGFATRAVGWYEARPAAERARPLERSGLAEALDASGHPAAADSIWLALAADPSSDIEALGALGVSAARRGDRAEAARRDSALAAMDRPYRFGGNTYQRARIAAQLGQRDQAVQFLRVSFGEGRPYDLTLHTDQAFDPLHGYAPFELLLQPADPT